YSERNAITRDQSGRYVVNYARMPAVIADLARELLQMEATGNRARVEQWFQKYNVVPTSLKTSLEKISSVPVDIDPISSFPEPIEFGRSVLRDMTWEEHEPRRSSRNHNS